MRTCRAAGLDVCAERGGGESGAVVVERCVGAGGHQYLLGLFVAVGSVARGGKLKGNCLK